MIIVGDSVFIIISCRVHRFLFLNYTSIILFLGNISHSPRYVMNMFISFLVPFIWQPCPDDFFFQHELCFPVQGIEPRSLRICFGYCWEKGLQTLKQREYDESIILGTNADIRLLPDGALPSLVRQGNWGHNTQ